MNAATTGFMDPEFRTHPALSRQGQQVHQVHVILIMIAIFAAALPFVLSALALRRLPESWLGCALLVTGFVGIFAWIAIAVAMSTCLMGDSEECGRGSVGLAYLTVIYGISWVLSGAIWLWTWAFRRQPPWVLPPEDE